MTSASLPRHGGDLTAATVRFGVPAAEWLDLSTGINPNAWPVPPLAPDLWARLPDRSVERALIDAAAAAYGTGPEAVLVAAPGTQALILAIPRRVAAEWGAVRVAVVSPTYGEHAPAWRAAGHAVAEVSLDEATALARAGGVDVGVVVNPNNPDGRLCPAARLEALRRSLRLLVVDEAFADVDPAESLAGRIDGPGLVVLRSFGKFFGLAGVRLGFALVAADRGARLAADLGPWAVSGPALAVGALALADSPWIDATRQSLHAAAARLDGVLAAGGLSVVGGTALFRLAACGDAPALFERLGRQGILVRIFPHLPGRVRVGLPGDDAGFARLAAALAG